MKRLLSLLLSAALLAALTVSPAAEEAGDARLARVTQAVKRTLDLDTDAYETFHGSFSEELVPVWDLSWEAGRSSLSVQALEDGTVVSLYRWESQTQPAAYRSAFPTFPDSAAAGDRALAEEFLNRVLRPGETAELEEPEGEASLNGSNSSWSGYVLLNGLPSPLHWHLTVENGQVTQFSRDVPETAYIGTVPSPEAGAGRDEAEAALKDTLALRLEYVLDKPTDTRAVLRYTPEPTHEFQVDAKTGEFLDVTELEELLNKGYNADSGGAAPAPTARAEAAAGENGALTEVEQEGVRQLEGTLSKEELDKALRAESAYGLRGYALISAAYESGEEQVLCTLRYARTENGERLTRNITVDARTGAVESVRSSAPFDREKTVTEEEALKKAEAFCKVWCPDRDLVLYQTDYELTPWLMKELPYWGFTFAQEVNGLPFRQNAVYVNIDAADGSVYGLSSSWDGDVTFDSANGTVSMETALAAWAGTYETVLAYRAVPQKLTSDQSRLIAQGVDYYYGLRLTYGLEREEAYGGVDARTGKPVPVNQKSSRAALAYADLSGSSAKADIEKLARYGVGYASDAFRPSKTLTQWELVCLAYSLQGTALDPDAVDKDDRENTYYAAYRMGLLTPAERDDDAVLTRGQVVQMLLNAAGYGPAARLGGDIFTCGYSDKESIPSESLGYAAVAQALGMASGTYAGSRSATRGEAASMLCRVLERAV